MLARNDWIPPRPRSSNSGYYVEQTLKVITIIGGCVLAGVGLLPMVAF